MKRAFAVGCMTLGLLSACTGEAPAPVSPPPPPTATAQAAATEAAPAPSAAVAAPPALPARGRVDMSAAIARLPKNAAVYGLFRPVAGDTLIEWARNPEGARRELRKLVPSGTFLEIVTTLGVDPAVPVAFAVLGPDLVEARKLIDSLLAAASASSAKSDPVAAAFRATPANGTLIRFVFRPGVREADTLPELERISEAAHIGFVRCPEAPQCAYFRAEKPIGVIDRGNTTMAFYKQAGLLEVDWLESAVVEPDRRVKLLADRRDVGGGPSGMCSRLDSEADLSFCVDGTRAGELGAALGLFATATTVQHGNVDPNVRGKLMKEGKREALVNLALAAPKRKLVDDGTFAITIAKSGYTASMSWLLTEASMASAQSALGREACATPKSLGTDLFPALEKAFADPGGDFRDWKKTRNDFRDAGFASLLIAFARIWPNMVPLAKGRSELATLPFNRVCARASGDRLELRAEGAPLDPDRL